MWQTSRRSALTASPALAAAFAAFARPLEAALPTASGRVAEDYVRVRTNVDGAPTWWLSRGIRYLLADYQLTPLHALNMASCVVADRRDDGSFVVRTLEGSYATDLATGSAIDSFVNPASGARVPLTANAPVVVTYQYHADGRMTAPAGEPPRPGVDLRGAIAARSGFSDGLAVEERFTLRTRSKTSNSDLSEQITFAAAAGVEREATKSVVVLRNWPFDKDQAQLLLFATYQGRRFNSFAALMDEVGAGVLETAQPGFAEKLAAYR